MMAHHAKHRVNILKALAAREPNALEQMIRVGRDQGGYSDMSDDQVADYLAAWAARKLAS